MSDVRSVTIGATATRTDRLVCPSCSRAYEATLTALGSVTGLAASRDDPALAAKAQGVAEANLARLNALEPCPGCGRYTDDMVHRVFRDAAHASVKRRYDEAMAAVNSPFARARRLATAGVGTAEIEEALRTDVEAWPLLFDIIQALGEDPIFSARDTATVALTEGELLVEYLRARHGMDPVAIEEALAGIYRADERLAERMVDRVVVDRRRREGSLGLLAAGIAVMVVGAVLAFVLAFVLPAARKALAEKARREEKLRNLPKPLETPRIVEAVDEGAGLTARVSLQSDRSTFSLKLAHRAFESRFGNVLLNGHRVEWSDAMKEGDDPVVSLDDPAAVLPEVFSADEPRHVGILAQVFDITDPDGFRGAVPRSVSADFEVVIPRGRADGVSGEDIVRVVARPVERPGARVEEALGAAGMARLDAALFGDQGDRMPSTGAALSEMDRDIRRAELKERAHYFLQALAGGDRAAILEFVVPEARAEMGQRLLWLDGQEIRVWDGQFVSASPDDAGEHGAVEYRVSVDHPEGNLTREGGSSWSHRDGRWYLDPVTAPASPALD